MKFSNQILTHDQLSAKLEDDHLKRTTKINRIEGLAKGMLENFVDNATRIVARLQESMVYIDCILHDLVDWSIYFDVEAIELCSMKWREVNERMELWNIFF